MLGRQYLKIIAFFITAYFSFEFSVKSQTNEYVETEINQSTLDTLNKYASMYPDNTQFSLAVVKDSVVSFVGVLKINGKLVAINNKDSVFEVG